MREFCFHRCVFVKIIAEKYNKTFLGLPLTELIEKEIPSSVEQQSTSVGTNIFRRAFLEARTNRNNNTKNYRKLGSAETTRIALICSLYQIALHTLTQMKMEILTGEYW